MLRRAKSNTTSCGQTTNYHLSHFKVYIFSKLFGLHLKTSYGNDDLQSYFQLASDFSDLCITFSIFSFTNITTCCSRGNDSPHPRIAAGHGLFNRIHHVAPICRLTAVSFHGSLGPLIGILSVLAVLAGLTVVTITQGPKTSVVIARRA